MFANLQSERLTGLLNNFGSHSLTIENGWLCIRDNQLVLQWTIRVEDLPPTGLKVIEIIERIRHGDRDRTQGSPREFSSVEQTDPFQNLWTQTRMEEIRVEMRAMFAHKWPDKAKPWIDEIRLTAAAKSVSYLNAARDLTKHSPDALVQLIIVAAAADLLFNGRRYTEK